MKRVVLPLVIILLLAGGGIYLQRRVAPHARQVASWLPASTILFEDVPDIHRTQDRWPETALAQIINEPEVQAFLQRPKALLPRQADLDAATAQFHRIDPLHIFLAVTDWNGSGAPSVICGMDYGGNRSDVESLVGQLRSQVQKQWPAGKSDVEKYGSDDIETFTTPDFSAAIAYRGQWVFISTDASALEATLDRFEGKHDPNNLADLPAFKKTLEHLPGAPDNLLFIQPALLADKAATFELMLNPTGDARAPEALKKIASVGLALKLDGEVLRDAAYVVESQPGSDAALARDSLRLSSSDTIIAVSSRTQLTADVQLPDAKSDPSGIMSLIGSYLKVFQDQGLDGRQFSQAFGPETGFVMDWPAGSMIPTPLAMLDVKDLGLAKKFMDTLASLQLAAGVEFIHTDEGGISFYSLPRTGIGFLPLQFTLGLTKNSLIGALSPDAVKEAAEKWDAHAAGIASTETYKRAASLVADPTVSFTYVDTKAVFDHAYGILRGVASMGFIPHLSDYVEVGKLPSSETISRHLSPIVTSWSVKDGGLLMESAGPVTTTEAVATLSIAAGAAAFPFIEQQIKGQTVTMPSLSGFGSKPGITGAIPFGSLLIPTPSVATPAPAATPLPMPPASFASPSGGTP